MGGSGLRSLRYAAGRLDASYFRRGTAGQELSNQVLSLHKSGTYTFYAADYAGNESILHYQLSEDTDAPQITYSLHTSPSGNVHQLIAQFTEQTSELSAVYLFAGEYDSDTFPLAEATPLSPCGGRINLRLLQPGHYTMYAKDIRGNTSTTTLLIPQPETEPTDKEEVTIDEFH